MPECYGQLVRCASLSPRALVEGLGLPARPWSSDVTEAPPEVLTSAVSRGERLVLSGGTNEWVLSVDRDTATVGLSADLESYAARTRRDLTGLLRRLSGALAPSFAWMDRHGAYPSGLLSAVDRTEVSWIFSWNFYGTAFLEKFGRPFFETMPQAAVETLQLVGVILEFDEELQDGDLERVKRHYAAAGQSVKRYARQP
jgi:hypothetical protein